VNQNIEDELFKAYLESDYVVKDAGVNITIQVGEKNADLDNLFTKTGKSTGSFLTAYNPYSKELSSEENESRQDKLLSAIKTEDFQFYNGYGKGKDESWQPEPSILILGIDRDQSIALAQQFEQNAIIFLEKGKEPILVICR
jgi:hypothetical protein